MPRCSSAKIWIPLKPFPTTEVSSIHVITHIQYCIVFVLSTSAFTEVSTDFVQPTGFLILLHHSAAFNIVSCPSLEISFSFVFRATVPSCFPPAFRLRFLYLDSFSFFSHSLQLSPRILVLRGQPPSTVSTIPINSHLCISLTRCFHQQHTFTEFKV